MTIFFDEALAAETSAITDISKPLVLFFDKRQSIGQMIDSLCRQLLLTSCTDYSDVESNTIYVYAKQVNQTL